MSVQEEIQGGRMKGGGCEEKDHGGYSKRVRDEEQNTERVERQDECSKKRRTRSENWTAKETLQLLELRKAIVQTSIAKGSDAWKQIAQQLAGMNPESQARSSKQVSQRWDTLVKIYVSVEEQCCETAKTNSEVIDERQKRCKTEYRQLWHELIAQGNPGKRRTSKIPVQPDVAHASLGNGVVITQALAASSSQGVSQAAITYVRKFGEIAKPFTEMLDTIDRSISCSEERNEVLGQANRNIVTDSNWGPEDSDQELETTISVGGLKKQQDKMKVDVARATQSMADTMDSILQAASTSESFCLEVDRKDWIMVIQRLSAVSQRYQEISGRGMREEVGADTRISDSQQQTISAARSTHDHTLSLTSSLYIMIRPKTSLSRTSSLNTKIDKRTEEPSSSGKRNGDSTASPATSTGTFSGLTDIAHLSPKSDCESLSGSRWLEAVRTEGMEKEEKMEEKKEKKKKTGSRTSILKNRQRTMTRTRFGPRV